MRRDPRIPALGALAGALLLPLVWLLAFHGGPFRRADESVLRGFSDLYRGRMAELADVVPHLADPQPFMLVGLVLVGIALYRRRGRVALAAGTILLGANVTTQVLKVLLAHARVAGVIADVQPDAWPSGHATASMSMALAAVLVASVRWRPVVAALGALWTLAITFTLLVAAWHFPSDVVGGYLVAGTWTAGAVAVLWTVDGARAPDPARAVRLSVRQALRPLALVALGGALVAVLAVFARPVAVTEYASAHTVFVAGAALLAALVLSLAAVMSAALTSTRGPAER